MAAAKPFRNPSGDVVYRVQFRVEGKAMQRTFDDETGADEFAAYGTKWGWPAALQLLEKRRTATTVTMTLREWVDKYLDLESGILTGIERGTRDGYRSIAKNSFLLRLGDHPVDLITKDDVGAWVAWQEQQPARYGGDQGKLIAAKTVKNYHGLLSNIFSAAVDRGIRPDNPARKTRLTKGLQREAVFLSVAEYRRLYAEIPERYQPLMMFLAGTGARWGEITAITWRDVNDDTVPATIRIHKAWKKAGGSFVVRTTKTRAGRRTVSITPMMRAALGQRAAADELVFKSPLSGNQIRYAYFRSSVWAPAVKRAQLTRDPNIHDLRHTHASWLIADGRPLPHIQARLGHENIQTTVGLYGHLLPDAHTMMAESMGFLDPLTASNPQAEISA